LYNFKKNKLVKTCGKIVDMFAIDEKSIRTLVTLVMSKNALVTTYVIIIMR